MGEPDHILPYNNTYDVQVVVGDVYLRETITVPFAKFNIKFKKTRTLPPPSDLDFDVLPEIKHTFPEPV